MAIYFYAAIVFGKKNQVEETECHGYLETNKTIIGGQENVLKHK